MSLLCREYEINESNYICLSHLMLYFDKFHIGEKDYIERREKSQYLIVNQAILGAWNVISNKNKF
jgi:hypothetical protein